MSGKDGLLLRRHQTTSKRNDNAYAPHHQEAAFAAIGSHLRKKQKRPLVLVVDDYEDTRRIYGDYLRFAGFQVSVAVDGEEAIAKALDLAPDLIIMDLAMPNVDGWTATRRLKADPRTREIYVMVLTSFSGDEHRLRAWRSGCDAFLVKPILPAELVRRIVGRLTHNPLKE